MDPLEHFEEQMRSQDLLMSTGRRSLPRQQEVIGEHPDFDIVGLILEANAPEAGAFRQAMEQATGQSLAGRGLRAIVPRQLVLEIIRANAPVMLEWLPDQGADQQRVLPLVAITKHGMRFGAIGLV
jgi:hypothetical protein